MKRTGPTKLSTMELIRTLDKQSTKEKSKLWKRIANELRKSRRARREVNVNHINRITKEGEIVIVPGKVLGTGELNHKVEVAALEFSEAAKAKINAKGKAVSIQELMKAGVKGKGVRIVG